MDEYQGYLYIAGMIGTRFREARLARGISLREVGEAIGVSPQAVAQWERTNPKFGITKTNSIANLLDVSVDWLEGNHGQDTAIERSDMYNKLQGRIPIIAFHHAILVAPFARTNFENIPFKETIEPSARIVGQGYAIKVQGRSDFLNIASDDILILDNGIKPMCGDIILGIEISEEHIKSVLARYVEDKNDPDFPPTLIEHIDDVGDFVSRTGGVKPIAVVVEHRRLRRTQQGD